MIYRIILTIAIIDDPAMNIKWSKPTHSPTKNIKYIYGLDQDIESDSAFTLLTPKLKVDRSSVVGKNQLDISLADDASTTELYSSLSDVAASLSAHLSKLTGESFTVDSNISNDEESAAKHSGAVISVKLITDPERNDRSLFFDKMDETEIAYETPDDIAKMLAPHDIKMVLVLDRVVADCDTSTASLRWFISEAAIDRRCENSPNPFGDRYMFSEDSDDDHFEADSCSDDDV